MMFDVHGPVAQCRAEIAYFPAPLAIFDAARRRGRFPDAAVDVPLRAQLGVSEDRRCADVDGEEAGDVLTMLRLDPTADLGLELLADLIDPELGCVRVSA